MRVLALDTTTQPGSAAIVDDARVVVERRGDASRTHGERLPAEIIALVDAAGVTMDGIDLFAVACGPGSFTGLRIGIATIQGLAFVTKRRVVAVSALEALAHAASVDARVDAIVGVWMDAHRHDVFSALYRVADATPFADERLVEVEGAAVGAPASTLARWLPLVNRQSWILAGDGAILYGDLARTTASPAPAIVEPPPLAGVIGRLAVARGRRGETVAPGGIRPLYVRRPDAVIAREQKDVSYDGRQAH